MKSYLIDEIPPPDLERLRKALKEKLIPSSMEQIFWAPLPDRLLTGTQSEHPECRPHVFAVELGPDWIKLEFFIRSLKKMRCTCPGYPTEAQRNHIMKMADELLEEWNVRT
jgi:hypothetical protein